MTAPLQLNKNYTSESLTVDSILHRAINDNNLTEVEIRIIQMLKRNTSEMHLYKFYRYAHVRQQDQICEYIKNILHIHYNTSEQYCQD